MSTEGLLPQHNVLQQRSANPSGLPTFIYEPLKSAGHIRLLRIPTSSVTSAGHSSSLITKSHNSEHYELIQASLVTYQNNFQAVSYVWGDPIQDHWIKINGQYSLPITKTLAIALPQLAQICPASFLWIDQVCIDQSNEHERGQQVLIMGEIYSSASRVLIWTGGELDGLPRLKTQLSQPGDLDESHTETLVQLLCLPWFSRGWTIQEAVLAKTAILIAGPCFLPLEDIEGAWLKKVRRCSDEQLDRCQIGKSSLDVIMALRRGLVARWHDSGFDGLLNSLGDTHTSDARDHVYAFLGLKHDPRIIIRPDYNASTGESFTSATRAIIEGTGTLDCFRYLPPSHQSEGLMLPSWVPNWSRQNRESRILQDSRMYGSHPPFRAAKGFSHNNRLPRSSRADVLNVSGRIVDFVELKLPNLCWQVYSTIYPKQGDSVITHSRFFSLTDEQVSIIIDRALTDPMQNVRRRLMSVIVAGHLDSETVLAMYDKGGENAWKPEKNGALSHLLRRLWHHQLWVTRSRKLALIPPSGCEEGDMLAVVHGLNAPLLLRNRRDGTYAVGGQCYLEDAMFGEAVTWKEEEADVFPLA